MSRSRLLAPVLALVATLSAIGVGVAVPASAADGVWQTGAPSAAPGGVAGTDTVVTTTVGGVARSYRVFRPSNLPAGPRPVVVALHWYSGDAAHFEQATGFDAGAVTNGALVVYPDGVGASWNAGACCGTARDQRVDDVAFLDAVLDDVQSRFAVDPARIAVGGWSNGGMMAYRYACERSDRVQSFFVGSGAPVAPACSFRRPVGVLHMHGLLDQTVPWNGTSSSPLTANGFPSIPSSVSGIAVLDGCSGWTTTKLSSAVTRYVAGCPTGASVTMLASSTMAHQWAAGASGQSSYGLDETGLTWSFLLGRWR